MADQSWYLVDLPGYGYARASKKDRHSFSAVITDYIARRESLSMLFVLVDSRSVFLSSADTGYGKKELLRYINNVNKLLKQSSR